MINDMQQLAICDELQINPGNLSAAHKESSPSPDEINAIVALFSEVRYADAANMARALTVRFPQHGFGWTALGAVLMQTGRSTDALAPLKIAVALSPNTPDAPNNLGVALLDLGLLDEAEASFLMALQIKQDYAEAHFNLGIALKMQGRMDEAADSFLRALQIKPNYAKAHNNLGSTYLCLGRTRDAASRFRQALLINPDWAEAHDNLGNTLRDLGQFDESKACFLRALQIKPDFAEAHNNLGITQLYMGRTSEAEACFLLALRISPDYAEALNNLGATLLNSGKSGEAETFFLRALQIKPDYAEAHRNMGNAHHGSGRPQAAETCLLRALQIKPDYAEAHSNLGCVLMDLGRMDEAESALNKALNLAPGAANPLSTALFYIPYRQDDQRFSQLDAVYASRELLPIEDRIRLNFAMGKAMESIGKFDQSFSAYEEGNRLHHQLFPYDDAEDERIPERSCSFFTPDLFEKFAAYPGAAHPIQKKPIPIFIVGMPRSGTTLIEQILASHPAIYGAGELTIFDNIAQRAELFIRNSTIGKEVLWSLRKLGQEYLDQVSKLAPNAGYISNKLPGNYYHLGLIYLMLPDAKIIHSMRDPMDTCFSCYTALFKFGHEYSYDLPMLGRQYLRYIKLMDHWRKVLPLGRMLDVHYEENVDNPEREARRLLDHLGLPWDSACLRFYETRRAVSTASVIQVRKPVYKDSVARWKRFESCLKPLREMFRHL